MASRFTKISKTAAFQVPFLLSPHLTSFSLEIYILCDPHTSFERSYALPEVVKTHTPYLFEEPKIILDDFLGTFEKHECVIIEADVFDSYVDPDAEDQTNDVLGSFTFERTDFENGISYKVRDGYVEVALICGNC